MNKVMKQNDQYTFFLDGYDGSVLAYKLNKKMVNAPITHPNTQKRIVVLAKARMHGALFHATGGGHITHDVFKSMAISVREKEIKSTENKKVHQVEG